MQTRERGKGFGGMIDVVVFLLHAHSYTLVHTRTHSYILVLAAGWNALVNMLTWLYD